MGNRLAVVLYVLAIGWAAFWYWGMAQSGPQFMTAFYIYGLPPLVLVAIFRFVLVGRL